MKTSDFYYDLPEELIAQTPIRERDHSRLMVVHEDGRREHRHFHDILEYFSAGDCLVLNETKVIPARLIGTKKDTGAIIELLLLKRLSLTEWECLVRPGKKLKEGAELIFGDILSGKIKEVLPDGNRIVEFSYDGVFEEILDSLGEMPVPPYIHEKLEEKERYNTVYARNDGSAAAPTAGLHWTEELLKKAEEKGVMIARITLHVGLGTFRPVKSENVEDHLMHSEFYMISEDAASKINRAKKSGCRVIATGTTSCRTIEAASDRNGLLKECSGWTDIFIKPGYRFKCMDVLITNFHLPESTLIMLVSAFAGRERVLESYKEAVDLKYRFFSFGDASLFMKADDQDPAAIEGKTYTYLDGREIYET